MIGAAKVAVPAESWSSYFWKLIPAGRLELLQSRRGL
jgi:hypothetical protein